MTNATKHEHSWAVIPRPGLACKCGATSWPGWVDADLSAQQPAVDVDALADKLTCALHPVVSDFEQDRTHYALAAAMVPILRAHLAPAPGVVGKMGIVAEMDIALAIRSGALKLCPACEDATCSKHAPEVQEAVQAALRQAQEVKS